MEKLVNSLKKNASLQRIPMILVVVVVAGLGYKLLNVSHAATPYVSSSAASGVLGGTTNLVSGGSNANSQVVQFGTTSSAIGSAPATPAATGATICGNSSVLNGPGSAPAGAVTVSTMSGVTGAGTTGSPYNLANVSLNSPNTTYYFPSGTYVLGTSQYSQIGAGQGDTYEGGPNAILSGQHDNVTAFVASYQAPWVTNVTIEHLTIEDFVPGGSGAAVNTNAGSNWTVKDDTIQDNAPGSAMMIGSNDTVDDNCLTQNGQYAFNAYLDPSYPAASSLTGGPENITLDNNEISYNDTCNWEDDSLNPVPSGSIPANCSGTSAGQFSGCGCAGGGKFWHAENVTADNNYVHDNYDVGLWADTNNDGFQYEGNYISNNYAAGIQEEVSYNALIKDNTFVGNAIRAGPTNPGFPTGAIYVSESGGDSRVSNSFNYDTLDISDNTFTNNWDGVVLWENANRFCGDNLVYEEPDSTCTLVDPSVASTPTVCADALESASKNQPTDTPDYFDLCRWKTQNVNVSGNTFNFTAADVASNCTTANSCGMNALFSEYGSSTDGVPYGGKVVPDNITFDQSNVFSKNTYNGPWAYFAWSQGNTDNPVSWAHWTAAVSDKCESSAEQSSGACNSGFGQDSGSTYNP